MAEIRSLTGLRGVAALTVFLAHTRQTLSEHGFTFITPDWFDRLFLSGGRQVDIFFVLSGFIMAMNYRAWFAQGVHAKRYFDFLRRRFARIYPLHAVILGMVACAVLVAGYFGMHTYFGLDRFRFSQLPAHLLLVHAWGPFLPNEGYWNPPSWSISIEALAYLLFPFLIAMVYGTRTRRPWLALTVACVIGAGLNMLTHWGLSGFAGVARGLSEFFLGCLLLDVVESGPSRWLQTDAGSLAAVAFVVLVYLLEPDTGFDIALCAAPLLLCLNGRNHVARLMACKPVYFLGEISYSIYLGHFLLSSTAYRVVSERWMHEGGWQTWAGIALIVAFVLCLSTVLYYLIERPGRAWLSGRKPASSVAAPAA